MASICLSQQQINDHNYQQQQRANFQRNNMLIQQHHHQTYMRKFQSIAPAPSKILGNSNMHNIQISNGIGAMLPRKKYNYHNMPYGEQLPSVARRNARERNRVKQVNNGFATLRQHLPQTVINTLSHGGRGASKKLSKVDTLRIAVEYIRGLQDLLEDTKASGSSVQTDESSNDGSNFCYSSMGSPSEGRQPQQQQQKYNNQAYNSEASASPTPSFADSDGSVNGINFMETVKLEPELHTQQMQFKFEEFEDFSPHNSEEQPDDEELLDYISLWQEQ